jgi:hypothetical protein
MYLLAAALTVTIASAHRLASAVAMTFGLGIVLPASAQDLASQIVGVWKVQKFDLCKVGTDECAAAPAFGDQPSGVVIFAKSGVLVTQVFGTSRVVPKTPDPTDEERVALFKSMFAWGGNYKLEGNKITTQIEFAWIESWKGQKRVHTFKVEGTKLTVASSPFKSVIDGATITARLVLERIE